MSPFLEPYPSCFWPCVPSQTPHSHSSSSSRERRHRRLISQLPFDSLAPDRFSSDRPTNRFRPFSSPFHLLNFPRFVTEAKIKMGYKGSMHGRRQQSSQKRATSTSGRMAHPCDGKGRKHFDQDYKDFAADPRNIRLSVTVKASPSSDWEIFLNILNGPPGTVVKPKDMHPTLIIPGPKVPKKLNVLIEPLLDELLEMWEGIETWDASVKRFFKMRAAVLWLHDFPDYSDLSGWSKRGTVSADISGSSRPTSSPKVQKCSDDCSVAVSAEHQINDGLPHGRLPIGGGAVSEAFTETLKLDTPPPPEILQGGTCTGCG